MLHIKKGSAQMVMGALVVSTISFPFSASAVTLDSSNNNSGIFSYTGAIDTVNITTTGIYTIDAFGAQGGSGGSGTGGLGGETKGDFNLTAGQVLVLVAVAVVGRLWS
jgi:hypothetical protein